MLLRNSISTTKRFFQKTLQNFKSLFAGDSYKRIPKTSPYNNHPYDMNINVQTAFSSNKDLDKLYSDFRDRWDVDNNVSVRGKAIRRRNKKTIAPPSEAIQEKKDSLNGFTKFSKMNIADPPVKDYQIRRKEDYTAYNHNNQVRGFKRFQQQSKRDEERSFLVAQKLKELEMMDISNVDHVLDIEEVLHYYSRLTCPAYLDIVDKFFMDMYGEFFGTTSTPRRVNSRPVRQLPSSLRS